MGEFRFFVFTPAGHDDPSLAIAASRAGAVGVFDAEYHAGAEAVFDALDRLARHARNPFGLRLGNPGQGAVVEALCARYADGLHWVVCDAQTANDHGADLDRFRAAGGSLLIEVCQWEDHQALDPSGPDGWIVKGHEAGGWIGEETTFILLQKALSGTGLPVYARGGIGIHTVAACAVAGAAGAVLDSQTLLLRESPVREVLLPIAGKLVGNETVALGDPGEGRYFRILDRPGFQAVKKLRAHAERLPIDALRGPALAAVGWTDPLSQLMPLGQDIAFGAAWAERYVTVAGVLSALRGALIAHVEQAHELRPLGPDSLLAESHGTRYPIVQGPMTRVSDTAEFAASVADEGGLPMLALALMKGPAVRQLLADTTERLRGKAWGVGILGFAPADLLKEQVAIAREFEPAFALIAGGRPEQALALEESGVPSYLHVPSPRLLSMFLEHGARRFVFEGRECGGHIGPLSSFVLWESMVETLLSEVSSQQVARETHILFAGGINDARSAAMVATLAAPLAARGINVGVLMGSAYLFTQEIVTSGSIVETFQEQVLQCDRTVGLETGTGHASRCADTAFAQEFLQLKRTMLAQGKSADEIRDALEDLNLGRLRLASKGKDRSGPGGEIEEIGIAQQVQDGMYMLGQVATLSERITTVASLHDAVSEGSCGFIAEAHEGLAERTEPSRRPAEPSDVAIIGMGAYMPKAGDVHGYWNNIINAVDCVTEIPSDRWDWRLYFNEDRNADDTIYSRWGGFMDDMVFDPMNYGIPPKSIKAIDPLQLMSLEVLRSTLDDAGYDQRDFDREHVSVILGASGGAGDLGAQYAVRSEMPRFLGELPPEAAAKLPTWTEDSFAGILLNVAAGRAANRFDFGGLNFTVDAACASSLAAVHQGVIELEDHRSDMVIVGGVDTVQGPFGYLCFSQTQALSPRGQCSTFDTASDGIVISEGIAMLCLKRLADAERDGDRIYAVIKGVGGSSDGRAKSMTAPHPDGQIRALERAYRKAGYSPGSVGLFEAHGTGTVAGDTAELETVSRLLAKNQTAPRQCAIGSVKTLIGHTKATAGVAGLIKAALAVHHGVLPPHANVKRPNQRIADPDSPLYLVRAAQPWITGSDESRRAGVSAFGFGGTNFHVTLEEYQGDFLNDGHASVWSEWHSELFAWRGADANALADELRKTAQAIAGADAAPCLRDLAYTMAKKLPRQGQAVAIVAATAEDLLKNINGVVTHIEDPTKPLPPAAVYAPEPLGSQGKVALLFAGQGSQYPNMLRELAIIFPDIPDVLARADQLLDQQIQSTVGPGARLSRIIYTPGLYTPEDEAHATGLLQRTEITQPSLGVVEAGLWRLMQRFGLCPDMAAGHSYGEFVALYAAGVLSLDDLLQLSEARGRFIKEAGNGKGLGTMAAVRSDRATVEEAAKAYADLIVANHNAPEQSILSGSHASIEAVVDQLNEQGVDARVLPVGAAFHSSFVAAARDRLAEFIDGLPMQPPEFPVYSNTTGGVHSDDVETMRSTLADHLASPVEFVTEIESMYEAGARIFVGLGPKNVQISLVDQILQSRPHRVVRIDDHEGGLKGLLQGLGALLVEGVDINLMPLFESRDCRTIDLNDLAQVSRGPARPRHAWLLNGAGARPIGEPPPRPLTLEDVQRLKQQQPVAAVPPAPAQQTGFTLNPARRNKEMSHNVPQTMEDRAQLPAQGESPYAPATEHESLLAAYQDTMRQFLQVQENVMMAYLTGSPARTGAGIVQRQPAMRALPTPRPAVARPQLVPSAPTPQPAAPVAAAPQPVAPVTAPPAPAPEPAQPAAAAEPAAAMDAKGIAGTLLSIVEDRTGYPQEMLGLEQNMEADLGIDSIKRVEIVGTLLKALPAELVSDRSAASESLNGMKTLQSMIDYLSNMAAQEGATSSPFEQAGPGAALKSSALLPRFIVKAQLDSAEGIPLDALEQGVYLITDDGTPLGTEVADLVRAAGGTPLAVDAQLLSDEDGLDAFLNAARADQGPIRGVIHLLPASAMELQEHSSLADWRAQTRRNELSLYRLLQMTAGDLLSGGRVVAATGLGGYFGRRASERSGLTAQGGSTGLLKSVNDEWPETRAKAVDLDLQVPEADNARHLLTELRLPGGRIEVGYPRGARTIFRTVAAAAGEAQPVASRDPDGDWVVLATGGARGITAEVLMGLAEKGVTLILVGRTPEPVAEDVATAALESVAELRRHLLEQARAEKRTPKPVEIERGVSAILRDREIAANLADFRKAGAVVDYRIADVRDETQVGDLLADIYAQHGRLDGVIHAAGIIEDKLLVDKDPASAARVFDTKVDGAYVLSRSVQFEQLRFMVFFTSVAGRYGNSGQTDYAMANELLNRLAWQLHDQCQGDVKIAAINWGPWDATRHGQGMVTAETKQKFESLGVTLVDPAGGRQLFMDEIVRGSLTEVEVVAGDGPWETEETHKGAFDAEAEAQRDPGRQEIDRYPLLAGATRTSGPRGEIIFRRSVNARDDHYLSEHMLDETPVLPAAVALEIMAEAAAAAWPDWVVNAVSDLRVLNGIKFDTDSVELEIVALASSHGDADGFDASMTLRPVGEDKKLFYRASVRLGSEPLESTPYQATLQPGPASIDVAHAYRNLLFHGPCFQTMRAFDGIDERGALVPVDPTEPEQWLPGVGGGQSWLFDPGLIDSGPQMALVWVNVLRSASALPSRFGRVRRFGSGPLGPCRMYFLVYGDQTEEQVKADVAFVDETGHLRLFIEEMECTSSPALNRLGGGWKGEIRAAPLAAGTGGDRGGRHASDQS